MLAVVCVDLISNEATDSCATNCSKAAASGQYSTSDGTDSRSDRGIPISC